MGGVRPQVTEGFCQRPLLRGLFARSGFINLPVLFVDPFSHSLFPMKAKNWQDGQLGRIHAGSRQSTARLFHRRAHSADSIGQTPQAL